MTLLFMQILFVLVDMGLSSFDHIPTPCVLIMKENNKYLYFTFTLIKQE